MTIYQRHFLTPVCIRSLEQTRVKGCRSFEAPREVVL
ncbi:hypothetical protein Poras_0303 [Porphyromonas asaccharolytica DSM 20707]|uniref:Uncharacterized protein n=1 Tax=Porphyromonas asaccharolytica (strain ATCC 25260 / DSM 20707 / BCRC 10618 / CCUG 7834 / JCM 6326 / LMG 13178 / VPI 4198 / B440) TaxID=879243 RepID=F4KMD8_PORAD|nr:hypothetical protein Poras_0303 [Porphyromonas asaccharolytica DSM 20707]